MLLAGDLGGTKTLLGLFERADPRPAPVLAREYSTQQFDSFTAILEAFSRDAGRPLDIDAVAIGVAGPVVNHRAKLPHVRWDVSATEVTGVLRAASVALMNDLEVMAMSVPVLTGAELVTLQAGVPDEHGTAVIIAAGTGLGEAFLHRVDNRWVPMPSETGHTDFAARTDLELDLLRMIRSNAGRVQIEDVVSGTGIVNLHRFTHRGQDCDPVRGLDPSQRPAAISAAGLDGRCHMCRVALDMFVDAYGAEAGNLGLRGVATAGVFVGGGIAPKILPALQDGRFMDAFRAKAPMSDLMLKMPVHVIMNPDAGLIGAAVAAQHL